MKRILLVLFIMLSGVFASDFWESSWNRGETSYFITNKLNERLSFTCSSEYAHLSVQNSNGNFVGTEKEIISVVLNENNKITIPAKIEKGAFKTQHDAWYDLVYDIPISKSIRVIINQQEFIFKPNNSKSIEDISNNCREYFNL